MRFTNMLLSLALVAGLGAVAPDFCASYAQDAPATTSEAASFDESLLDVPEDESNEFYEQRVKDIYAGLNALSSSGNRSKIEEILPKVDAAMKIIMKKLAFSDVEDSYNFYSSYTVGLAREGKLDELLAIQESEKSKSTPDVQRVGWVSYLVCCVSIDQAGEDAKKLDAAIKTVEELVMTDNVVASHAEEYSELVSQYDSNKGKALFKRIIAAFEKSDDAVHKSILKKLQAKERFANLLGNKMIVEGVFLDGTEIDWKSYRGKVVLVDFWATWCGPCVAEIPNVLALYKKYHDAGFEVIGYSLDQDLDALKEFEEKRDLPWKTASLKLSMEANKKDGKEYKDLSELYGINSIPTMILVDKDGTVINTRARGENLKQLLEKQFPEVK